MSIIKCPECGHQISEKATVCPICGIGIAGKVVRCAYCGEVYLRSDGLCPNCHRPAKAILFEDDEEKEEKEEKEVATVVDEPPSNTTSPEELKVDDNEQTDVPSDEHQEDSVADALEEEKSPEEEEYVAEDMTEATTDEQKTDGQEEEKVAKSDRIIDNEFYIDDEDNEDEAEETPETTDEEEEKPGRRRGFLPIAVSIAITALIAAVCLYFYNENKMTNERADLDAAINAGTKEAIMNFQRTHPDMSEYSKQRALEEWKNIEEREKEQSLITASRDKTQLLAYINKYPDDPKKAKILQTIDSIDWEEAKRINKKEAYEKYIAEHSNGIFVNEAKEKITVKKVEATEADKSMAKSLFRDFFLAVNGKDTGRLTGSMSSKINSFMGKENANNDDVVAWMKQQYEGDVQTVTWKLDHNYNIKITEQNDQKDYTMDFTGQRTSIHNDGRAVTEHYKFNAKVANGKISSLTMEKYTPSASSTSSSSKPTSSSGSSKPSSSSSSSKPSTSSSSSKPSSSSSSSKPSSSSSSSKPSSSSSSSKPSSSSSSSKPSTSSSSSKPSSSSGSSKPSSSSSSGKTK